MIPRLIGAQRVAGGLRGVSVIDEQHAATGLIEYTVHGLDQCFEARLYLEFGLRVWHVWCERCCLLAETERQIVVLIEADDAFVPGLADPDILLHWQAIEPFIGDDYQRAIGRHLLKLIQKARTLCQKLGREMVV